MSLMLLDEYLNLLLKSSRELGQNINNLIKIFDLEPRYGIKKYGNQSISKSYKNINSKVNFFYYDEIFYKINISKSLLFENKIQDVIDYFTKQIGDFNKDHKTTNETTKWSEYMTDTYTFSKELNKEIILKMVFIQSYHKGINSIYHTVSYSNRYNWDTSCYLLKKNKMASDDIINYNKEIEWYNNLTDIDFKNFEHLLDRNDLSKYETSFISDFVRKRKNNESLTYKQIIYLKNIIYEKNVN